MKPLLLFILCLYLTACSFGSTAYKHFDYIVLWYASDYVTLNKAQKSQLSDAASNFISWHRSNEVEKYKLTLKLFIDDIENQTMTDQRANYYRQQVRFFLSKVRFYLEPNLAPLLNSLTDSQYQQIAEALEDQINEENKELSPKKALTQMRKNTEQWYGPLKPTQLEILKKINSKRNTQRPKWQQENKSWLVSFQLASEMPSENRVNAIKLLLLEILTPTEDQSYTEKEDWMAIWRLADDKQRVAILTKLSEYQTLLDDISS